MDNIVGFNKRFEVCCNNNRESDYIQKELFSLGYQWLGSGIGIVSIFENFPIYIRNFSKFSDFVIRNGIVYDYDFISDYISVMEFKNLIRFYKLKRLESCL